jgi:hypothetical protein
MDRRGMKPVGSRDSFPAGGKFRLLDFCHRI